MPAGKTSFFHGLDANAVAIARRQIFLCTSLAPSWIFWPPRSISVPAPAIVLHPDIALNEPSIPSIISSVSIFLIMIDLLISAWADSGSPLLEILCFRANSVCAVAHAGRRRCRSCRRHRGAQRVRHAQRRQEKRGAMRLVYCRRPAEFSSVRAALRRPALRIASRLDRLPTDSPPCRRDDCRL